MKRTRFINLGIIFSFNCNINCKHCAVKNTSGIEVKKEDYLRIIKAISDYNINYIQFTGGEPFLEIDKIETLFSVIPVDLKNNLKVSITTNGYLFFNKKFAGILPKIPNLWKITISLDKFHSPYFNYFKVLKNAYNYCVKNNIELEILVSIEKDEDILFVYEYLKPYENIKMGLQKVLKMGNAEKYDLYYRPEKFDKSVLQKKCPNSTNLIYVCGKGFSTCCSYYILDEYNTYFLNKNIDEYVSSEFFNLVYEKNFGEIIDYFGLNNLKFRKEHSLICNLCRYIFNKAGKIKKPLHQ